MDGRTFYAQAAAAARAATLAVHKVEGHSVGLDSGAAAGADVEPRDGSGAAALVAVNGGDKASGGGGGVGNLICPECGKTFLSHKAMYGHMRCHPDRGYKGAIRPGTAGPAVALVSGGVKARKVPLPTKWPPVTARRGRTPTAPYDVTVEPAAVVEPTLSEEEEAAMTLLAMSSGVRMLDPAKFHMQLMQTRNAVKGRPEQLELSDHVAESAAMDLDPETEADQPMMMPEHAAGAGAGQQAEKPAVEPQTPEIEKDFPVLEHVAAMVTAAPEVEKRSDLEPVRDDALIVLCDKKRLVSPSAKLPKKRRLDNLVQTPPNPMPAAEDAEVEHPLRRIPSPASDRRYVCPTCIKSFPTHQALGGHMASHKKASKLPGEQQLEGRLALAHTVHSIMAQQHQSQGGAVIPGAITGLGGINLPPPLPAAREPLLHPCSRCSMIFRSGQALGGHMKKHWLTERQHAQEVASASAAALAQAAARPIVLPRDFDLNELPLDLE